MVLEIIFASPEDIENTSKASTKEEDTLSLKKRV